MSEAGRHAAIVHHLSVHRRKCIWKLTRTPCRTEESQVSRCRKTFCRMFAIGAWLQRIFFFSFLETPTLNWESVSESS